MKNEKKTFMKPFFFYFALILSRLKVTNTKMDTMSIIHIKKSMAKKVRISFLV